MHDTVEGARSSVDARIKTPYKWQSQAAHPFQF